MKMVTLSFIMGVFHGRMTAVTVTRRSYDGVFLGPRHTGVSYPSRVTVISDFV